MKKAFLVLVSVMGWMGAAQAFAGMSLKCEFDNGRVFVDSSYEVQATGGGRYATDYNGEIHMIATDLNGNSVEQKIQVWGSLFTHRGPQIMMSGSFGYRLQSCVAYFVGWQSDR